jgi:inosine-uridine nucleoside N-ribohydrolase
MRTRSMTVDVELRGELTRGMTVFDQRPWRTTAHNVEVAVEVDGQAVRNYIDRILKIAR